MEKRRKEQKSEGEEIGEKIKRRRRRGTTWKDGQETGAKDN